MLFSLGPFKSRQDEFPQNIPHQEKTGKENEPEQACPSVDQDEDRKQDPLQFQKASLEKNKVGAVRTVMATGNKD